MLGSRSTAAHSSAGSRRRSRSASCSGTSSASRSASAGGGRIAGSGSTVALLVATLAFEGSDLEEAKLGILSSALAAAALTWLLFRGTALLPWRGGGRGLLGTAEPLVDLYLDVDPERDHIRG